MAKKQTNDSSMFDGMSGAAQALGRSQKMFHSMPPRLADVIAPPQMLPIDQLLDNPYQPRGEIDAEELEGLVASIKHYGFRGSLLGRPSPTDTGYTEIAYGHRRREAARLAGLAELPIELADLSNREMAALAAVENIQREDLSLLEEGRLYQLMIDHMGYTQDEVAAEIGKSRGYVENRLRAAQAPIEIQEMIKKRPNTLHYVLKLTRMDEPTRRQVIEAVLEGRVIGEGIEEYAAGIARGDHEKRLPGTHSRPKYSRTSLDVALRAVDQFRRHTEVREAVTTEELVKLRHIRNELTELLAQYDIVG